MSARLRQMIEVMLEDGKAENVAVVDLTGKTTIADHMIIASTNTQAGGVLYTNRSAARADRRDRAKNLLACDSNALRA